MKKIIFAVLFLICGLTFLWAQTTRNDVPPVYPFSTPSVPPNAMQKAFEKLEQHKQYEVDKQDARRSTVCL